MPQATFCPQLSATLPHLWLQVALVGSGAQQLLPRSQTFELDPQHVTLQNLPLAQVHVVPLHVAPPPHVPQSMVRP